MGGAEFLERSRRVQPVDLPVERDDVALGVAPKAGKRILRWVIREGRLLLVVERARCPDLGIRRLPIVDARDDRLCHGPTAVRPDPFKRFTHVAPQGPKVVLMVYECL